MTLKPWTEHLNIRGMPLAVHRWGDPSASVLLMIHGFLDHGQSFQAMAERLCDRWQVVAPDMRGHGQSGWVGAGGNYHFADYYFDVATVLRQVAGGRPVDLLGHSMGGMIACVIAALHPGVVRAVALLDGMGPHEGYVDETVPRLQRWIESLAAPGLGGDADERRRARRRMPSVEFAAGRLQAVNPRLTPERALQLATTGTEVVADGVVWRHDPLHRTPSSRPFRGDEAGAIWQAIQQPVLSIYAAHSEWLPKNLWERHAQVRELLALTLPEAGHNLHHEKPELLADVVRAWFLEPRILADRAASLMPPPGFRLGEP